MSGLMEAGNFKLRWLESLSLNSRIENRFLQQPIEIKCHRIARSILRNQIVANKDRKLLDKEKSVFGIIDYSCS